MARYSITATMVQTLTVEAPDEATAWEVLRDHLPLSAREVKMQDIKLVPPTEAEKSRADIVA